MEQILRCRGFRHKYCRQTTLMHAAGIDRIVCIGKQKYAVGTRRYSLLGHLAGRYRF